jgi:hypothetical protein
MIEQVREIHSHFFDNSTSADIPRIMADLRHANITSDDSIFDISDIGYYGNTPLCISNIFKMQESYQLYKVVYSAVVTVLLIAVSGAYIMIVFKARRSRQKAGPNNVDNVSQLSWVSFILAVIVFSWFSKSPPPAKIFEVFALIVIPVNSLLNPIFYSGLYRGITSFLRRIGRKLIDKIRAQNRVGNVPIEIELKTMGHAHPSSQPIPDIRN